MKIEIPFLAKHRSQLKIAVHACTCPKVEKPTAPKNWQKYKQFHEFIGAETSNKHYINPPRGHGVFNGLSISPPSYRAAKGEE